MTIINVPVLLQTEPDAGKFINDCAPTCAAMLLKFYSKLTITVDQISARLMPKADTGVYLMDLSDFITSQGVPVTYGIGLTLDYLRSELRQGRPVIVAVDWYGPHAIVVIGFGTPNFTIIDPNIGRQDITPEHLSQGLAAMDNQFIQVLPKESKVVTLNVPYITQWGIGANGRRNDCGVACVAMLLAFYNKSNATVDRLSMDTPLRYTDAGLTVPQLVTLAGLYNLTTKTVSNVAIPTIKAEIDAGRPVICLVAYRDILGRLDQADRVPGSDGHFFVVIGYDDQDNFIIHDPDYWAPNSGKSLVVPTGQVDKALTDMGYGRQCLFVQTKQPEPIYGTAEVVDGPVRVRLTPNGTIIKMMNTGEQIEAVGDQSGWTQVLLPAWIKSEYLKKV